MFNILPSAKLEGDGAHAFPETHKHFARNLQPEAVPALFWPAAMVLIAGAVCLVCWGIYSILPQSVAGSEKYLQRALLSPRFNLKEADAPVMPELLPEPQREEAAVLKLSTDEPPLGLPVALMPVAQLNALIGAAEPPPPVPETAPPPPLPADLFVPPVIEPASLTISVPLLAAEVMQRDPAIYLRSTLGDTPMLRNWKTLAWCSLLTTTVIVQAPLPAAADEKEKEKTVAERIDDLDASIKESFKKVGADMKKIGDSIEALQDEGVKLRLDLAGAKAKIKQLENSVDKLRADLDQPRESAPNKLGLDKASVEAIKSKLSDIEQAILRLQPSPTTGRFAMSPPAATGRVVLVNLYPEELLFVVNQKNFRVAPGANVPLENIAAGVVNYEVISGTWGLRARANTNLAPNETVTLTAR